MFKYYDMFKANCKHTLVNSDKHRDTVILEYPYKIRRYRRTYVRSYRSCISSQFATSYSKRSLMSYFIQFDNYIYTQFLFKFKLAITRLCNEINYTESLNIQILVNHSVNLPSFPIYSINNFTKVKSDKSLVGENLHKREKIHTYYKKCYCTVHVYSFKLFCFPTFRLLA